jgi:hypothetical protein
MVMSKVSVANALLWIASFFASRVVFGTFVSARRIHDQWRLWGTPLTIEKLGEQEFAALERLRAQGLSPMPLTTWTFFWSMAGFVVLNGLNYIWFFMIVRTTMRKLNVSLRGVAKRMCTNGTPLNDTAHLPYNSRKPQKGSSS